MPHRELERLQAVNRFLKLNVSREDELQSIIKLAAEICGTPTALITLLDKDTQYIKFKHSFELETTSRRDSFCTHVIEGSEVMTIPDVQKDTRFVSNPLVVGNPYIRFYAGAPLTTADGYNVGSLCVIDQAPKELTKAQQQMLQILSKQVIQLLEFDASLQLLKEQFIEAKRAEIKMQSFFESTSSNHLLMDREHRVVVFNKAMKTFIKKAYDVELTAGMNAKLFINAAYLADFIENCNKALAGESIKVERELRYGAQSSWWDITYDPAYSPDGEIVGISFNLTDITQIVRQKHAFTEHEASLNQIAYMQSHELRRPVATIKGLLDILEMEGHLDDADELKLMQCAVNNLDEKIHLIVNHTNIATA